MGELLELEIKIFSKLNFNDNSILEKNIYLFIRELIEKYPDDKVIIITINDIVKLFKGWCERFNIEYETNNTQFGKILSYMKIDGITKGDRLSSGNTKKLDMKKINDFFKKYPEVCNREERKTKAIKEKRSLYNKDRYKKKKQDRLELLHLDFKNFD